MQEALTNVRRHAGPSASATVTVAVADGALHVLVENDGPVADVVGEGNGIPGMRERATALGGTLDAGPRPRGGFTVEAQLPLPESTSSESPSSESTSSESTGETS